MENRIDRIEGITPTQRQLYFALRGKWRRFNGAFYYDDKRLAYEQVVSERTIKRGVKRLKERQLIDFKRGCFKGKATYYIYVKDDKMSPLQSGKPDKKSIKPDKKSSKARQNVTPTVGSVSHTVKDTLQQSSPVDITSLKGHIVETQSELDLLLSSTGHQ